jgi:type IV pilus assembly protein PilO
MAESAAQQFTKLPSSSKVLLLALLLVMIGAGYYSSLHGPLTEEIDAAAAQRVALEDKLTKARDLQQRFLQLREELEVRKTAEQELVRVLPPRAEIASMLADLNRLAELSGLTMEAVEPSSEQAEQFYVRIPVNLAVSGKYHQLAKFFYNVSRLQRAINMENIVIAPPRDKQDEIILKVRVLATTFRRKDA